MSTQSVNKIDKERGNRHQEFRKEHLGLTQEQLIKLLKENGIKKSQSTISNYDRGSMPTVEVLNFYISKGMNVHWFFTGDGPMLWSDIPSKSKVADEEVSYKSLKGRLKLKFSNNNLAEFLQAMHGYREDYIGILNSSQLSKEEVEDLKQRIIEGIKEKITLIQ